MPMEASNGPATAVNGSRQYRGSISGHSGQSAPGRLAGGTRSTSVPLTSSEKMPAPAGPRARMVTRWPSRSRAVAM